MCALQEHYAAQSVNSVMKFQDNLRSHLQGIGCTETLVVSYHFMLLNNPKERISHLLRTRSLKSCNSGQDNEKSASCSK